jgi:hypothetical protein
MAVKEGYVIPLMMALGGERSLILCNRADLVPVFSFGENDVSQITDSQSN